MRHTIFCSFICYVIFYQVLSVIWDCIGFPLLYFVIDLLNVHNFCKHSNANSKKGRYVYLPIIHTDRAQITKPFLKFLLPIQVALDMSKGQVKVIYNVSCVAWLIFVSARYFVPQCSYKFVGLIMETEIQPEWCMRDFHQNLQFYMRLIVLLTYSCDVFHS